MKEIDLKFKVLVVGSSNVGKTAIIKRLINDTYTDLYVESPCIDIN